MAGSSLSLAGRPRSLIKARHTKAKSHQESPASLSSPRPYQYEGGPGKQQRDQEAGSSGVILEEILKARAIKGWGGLCPI